MHHILNKLTEIGRGMKPAQVLTLERIAAMQEAIFALARGENICPSPDISPVPGQAGVSFAALPKRQRRGAGHVRFKVRFDAANQRLHVGDGSVFVVVHPDGVKQSIHTMTPNLDGVSLAQNPYWDVSGKEAGKLYNVWCVIDSTGYSTHMQLVANDDEVDFSRGWLENAVCVASVTWSSGGNGLILEKAEDLIQYWWSDIPWFSGDGIGSSSSEDSSSDSSSDSDSSGSSSGSSSSDGSSDDDSSRGSSDDDSSGSSDSEGSCDPKVEITSTQILLEKVASGEDTANCFFNASDQEEVRVVVEVTVTGNPCNCRNGWVKVTVGSKTKSAYLGFGGVGSETFEFNMFAGACQEIPVKACWFTPSVGVDTGDPCIGQEACVETTITAPPVCGDGSCSDDSSDDSSDSSGSRGPDSSDSDSDSDSDDDSSDKNCIVPMLGGGHAALACIESPNTWFIDIASVTIRGRITRVPFDPKFGFVCEPGTLRAIACEGGTAAAFARIEGNEIVVTCGRWRRPKQAVVTLAGIRKGSTKRFPRRTRGQYERSQAFWKKLNQ